MSTPAKEHKKLAAAERANLKALREQTAVVRKWVDAAPDQDPPQEDTDGE